MSTSKAKLGRPVDADGDVTRTRILAAARTTFADLGYDRWLCQGYLLRLDPPPSANANRVG